MNVLYLHCHDLGDRHEGYQSEIETPNLRKFVGESTLFENAYAVAPTCSPSRAALLTSQSPHLTGMLGLAHRGFKMKHPERHLSNLLKEHGYHRTLCGIQHEFDFSDPSAYPYDEYLPECVRQPNEGMSAYQARRDKQTAKVAAEWLRTRDSKNKFFLSVGLFQPHRPFPDPDKDLLESSGRYTVPKGLADNDAVREDLAALDTGIRKMDEAVGVVLQAVKDSGHWDDTIILFTTDHGIAFPEHKCNLTRHGLKVSFLLRNPQLEGSHGKRISTLTSHLDFLPTLFDCLNLGTPPFCEGMSLLPFMEGTGKSVDRKFFGEVSFHAAYQPMRSIRTEKFNFIRNFDPGIVLPNIDDSPSKSAWLEAISEQGKNGKPYELYDLEQDPWELLDVSDDPAYAKVVSELREQLNQRILETGDPIGNGIIKPPAGALMVDRSEHSPHSTIHIVS